MEERDIEALCARAEERVYGGEKQGPHDLIAAMREAGVADPEKIASRVLAAWTARHDANLAWTIALQDAHIIAPWRGY